MSAEEQLMQIHRAIRDRDDDAWQTIYQTCTAYVSYWINRADSTHILSQQDRRDLVHEAFAKFYQACLGKTADHFPTMAMVYAYLRFCAKSVTLDAMGCHRCALQDFERSPAAGCAADPAELVVEAENVQELAHLLVSQVHTEQERIVVWCWLQYVPPDDMLRQYAHAFPNIRAIHSIQQSLRGRLCVLLQESHSHTCSMRDRVVAPERSIETSAHHVVIVPGTGTVTYHRQISYCGKQRCHKCREGTGHGPYWYAYTFTDGRSIRRYIGKVLP